MYADLGDRRSRSSCARARLNSVLKQLWLGYTYNFTGHREHERCLYVSRQERRYNLCFIKVATFEAMNSFQVSGSATREITGYQYFVGHNGLRYFLGTF